MPQEEELLLEAIRAAPDERDNYLVYGDWLAQRGDPRGELIGFQDALERDPGNVALGLLVNRLTRQQLEALPAADVTWKLGFISELRFDPRRGPRKLAALLQHPLLQLVESVSLVERDALFDGEASTRHQRLLACVVEHVPRAMLRRLEVGSSVSPLFDTADELQRVLAQMPRLTELTLHARTLPDGCIELLAPMARAVELATLKLTDKQLRTVAAGPWPHLRRLVLHLRRRARAAMKVSPLARLLTGRGFPALVDLRIREHERAGELTERLSLEIVRAPIAAQLEVLDFTVRGLDMDLLRPSYLRLGHIQTLLPSADDETDAVTLHDLSFLFEEPATERALRSTRRALERASGTFDRHNLNRRLGTVLTLLGRLDEALEAHDASLADDPGCGTTLLNKAITLKRMGRLHEAAEATARAETTTEHRATGCRLLYLKGSLGVALGDEQARLALEQALPLYVEELAGRAIDADLLFDHACLLCLLGDTRGALAALAASIAICVRYKDWARTEIDLASLRDVEAFRALIG